MQIAELDGLLRKMIEKSKSVRTAHRVDAIRLLQQFGSEACITRLREMLVADRRTEEALALLAGVALVNLAPDNPYPSAVSDAWRAGHFFNFSGLTRLASALWPYFALPYLMALQLRESRGRHAAHDHR